MRADTEKFGPRPLLPRPRRRLGLSFPVFAEGVLNDEPGLGHETMEDVHSRRAPAPPAAEESGAYFKGRLVLAEPKGLSFFGGHNRGIFGPPGMVRRPEGLFHGHFLELTSIRRRGYHSFVMGNGNSEPIAKECQATQKRKLPFLWITGFFLAVLGFMLINWFEKDELKERTQASRGFAL